MYELFGRKSIKNSDKDKRFFYFCSKFSYKLAKRTQNTGLRKRDDILQVNGVTNVIADFKLTHMKVLMVIISSLQEPLRAKINASRIGPAAFENAMPPLEEVNLEIVRKISIRVSEFGLGSNNNYYLLKSLEELRCTSCRFPQSRAGDKVRYIFTGLITHYVMEPYSGVVDLYILDALVSRLLFTEDGYGRYSLCQAMSFKNKYTVRLYWLISSWANRGGFCITLYNMRTLLSVEESYQRVDNFYTWVLNVARDELRSKSALYFEYRRRPSSDGCELITFKIKRALSEEDQKARLNSFRDYIFNFGLSLGLSDSSVMSIVSSVEPEDYVYACTKLGEIKTYVLQNRSSIRDVDGYVLGAIRTWLDNWEERFEEIRDR